MSANSESNELYELYALGLLEGAERDEVERALASGDPEAKERLRRALETSALLGTLAPEAEPPKQLRRRIVGLTRPAQSRMGWNLAWVGLSACLLVGLVYIDVQKQNGDAELASTRTTLEQTRATLAIREATLRFLRHQETKLLRSGAPAERQPVAKVFVNPAEGILLVASNLPALNSGRTYQMWVVPKVGGPVPAGLFQPGVDGSAVHLRPGAVDLGSAAAIALSDEPRGGSPSPTTAPFLITPVGD